MPLDEKGYRRDECMSRLCEDGAYIVCRRYIYASLWVFFFRQVMSKDIRWQTQARYAAPVEVKKPHPRQHSRP
jgi:hypothetical protein